MNWVESVNILWSINATKQRFHWKRGACRKRKLQDDSCWKEVETFSIFGFVSLVNCKSTSDQPCISSLMLRSWINCSTSACETVGFKLWISMFIPTSWDAFICNEGGVTMLVRCSLVILASCVQISVSIVIIILVLFVYIPKPNTGFRPNNL